MLSLVALLLTAQLEVPPTDTDAPDAGEVSDRDDEAPADAGVEEVDAGSPEVVISTSESIAALTGAKASTTHLRLRLGFLNEWGNHPGAPLGLALSAAVGGDRWTGVLEAWGLLPGVLGDTLDAGSLSVFSFGGTGGGCYEHPVLSGVVMGCALARGGVMRFEPHGVADLEAAWQPTLAAGLRAGGEWPRDSFIAFYVVAQGFVPIIKPYLRGQTVGWTQSWVFGGAQVGFRVRLQ